jgi:hypothetical protein
VIISLYFLIPFQSSHLFVHFFFYFPIDLLIFFLLFFHFTFCRIPFLILKNLHLFIFFFLLCSISCYHHFYGFFYSFTIFSSICSFFLPYFLKISNSTFMFFTFHFFLLFSILLDLFYLSFIQLCLCSLFYQLLKLSSTLKIYYSACLILLIFNFNERRTKPTVPSTKDNNK